jgi:hypothetical protein
MKKLPNGLKVFNATPHPIRFWREGWEKPVEVKPDEVISADVKEKLAGYIPCPTCGRKVEHEYDCPNNVPSTPIKTVKTVFNPTDAGGEIIRRAKEGGADVIVGSIIAAQAYPGQVVAMTPAPGYERVPPAQKRVNPDKFTVFE